METDELNPWAWLQADHDADPDVAGDEWVTAVLVTRNSERWIERALTSLSELDLPPSRVIVIDNESSDTTCELLAQAKQRSEIDAVYTGDATWGFSEAVHSALSLDRGDRHYQEPDWIWLLHDDIDIDPDCFTALLRRAEAEDHPAIILPKLLQGSRRGASRQISEIGVSISGSGNRVGTVEQGELDQGQHESTYVLGGSTCGMLVRADVWDTLHGLDPDVTLFRVGTEFGWRANLHGFRVATAPDAAIMHRHVGRAGLREGMPGNPTVLDRRNGMMVVAAHRRGVTGFLVSCWLVLVGLVSSLGFLLGKAPKRAVEELRAIGGFLRQQRRVARMRKRNVAIKSTRDDTIRTRALRPRKSAGLRAVGSTLVTWLGETWTALFGGMTAEATLDELTGDEFAGGRQQSARRPWLLPTVIVFAVVGMLTLIAARHLFSLGHLASSRLNPAQDTLGYLAADYADPIVGQPGVVAPPWVGLAAIASTVTLGQPEWFVSILVIACVPLAMLTSFAFLRRIVTDRRIRLTAALVWATIPALLGATARADLASIVTAVVLPLLGQAYLGWRRRGSTGVERWRGPFAVGLWLTVLMAFVPAFYVVAVVAAGVAIVVDHKRGLVARVLVSLVVPLALLSPWFPTLLRWPGRLLTSSSPSLAPLDEPNPLLTLLGRTPGPGLPALWLSASCIVALWVLALAGVALRPTLTRQWLLLTFGGLAGALFLPHLLVSVPPVSAVVRPEATPWLVLTLGCLLVTTAVGWDGVSGHLAATSFGPGQALSILALGVAVWVALIGLGSWVADGLGGPLHRTSTPLPAFVTQAQTQAGLRTLAVDVSGAQPRWSLIEGDGYRLGDTERGAALGSSADAVVMARQVVADMVKGVADQSLTDRLVALGVGHVYLVGAPADMAAAVSSTPGFSQTMGDPEALLWRVTTAPGGAYVDGAKPVRITTSPADVPDGGSDRRFTISQPRDPRWYARLNGRPLTVEVAQGDYRQHFVLGAEAGTLTWGLRSNPWWAWAQLAGLVVVAVLAAPSMRRTELRDPAQYARFAARLDPTEAR